MKKRYEVIWEIFNKCSGNQMRDVFFEDIMTDDPEAYIAERFKGYNITPDFSRAPGEIIYEIEADGLYQKMSLTEI